MTTTTTHSSFSASVSAIDASDAILRVARRLSNLPGFTLVGLPVIRSARHMLWTVTISNDGTGDVNHAWVTLTSYGICPDDRLGSSWAKVRGIGR